MLRQNSQNQKLNNDPLMSQLCTICKATFQLNEGEEPCVIQIENDYYCEPCLEKKLLQEQQNIKNLQQRYIYYREYESSFNTKEYCESELKQTPLQNQDLAEVQNLEGQALALTKLMIHTKQECKILKQKVIFIENQEEKFWDSVNRFEKRAIKLQEKALTAKLQRGIVKCESQELTRNSLYHEVFKITIKDNIGYISGLAMGKKAEAQEIQWEQFNIGLGHLFLGMNILIMKYEYSYVKFQQVVLKSNLSQVLLYGRQKKCSISYSKQNQKNFGQVMQGVLTQIFHFSYHLMQVLNLQYNPQVKLPYPIKQKQYKIAEVAINPNKISDKHKWQKWSQGIKYLLINFKHLMTIHVIYGRK